ncbi:MAG: integrase core domain-containing protein [Beijerinckiaceae bacterium]
MDFSRPGKSTENGHIEAFNSKLHAECLNEHWLLALADTHQKSEDWLSNYIEVRLHSVIGYEGLIIVLGCGDVTSLSQR